MTFFIGEKYHKNGKYIKSITPWKCKQQNKEQMKVFMQSGLELFKLNQKEKLQIKIVFLSVHILVANFKTGKMGLF